MLITSAGLEVHCVYSTKWRCKKQKKKKKRNEKHVKEFQNCYLTKWLRGRNGWKLRLRPNSYSVKFDHLWQISYFFPCQAWPGHVMISAKTKPKKKFRMATHLAVSAEAKHFVNCTHWPVGIKLYWPIHKMRHTKPNLCELNHRILFIASLNLSK